MTDILASSPTPYQWREPLRIRAGVVRARPIRVVTDHDALLMMIGSAYTGVDLVPVEPPPVYRAWFRPAPSVQALGLGWDALASALRGAVWRAA